MSDQQKQSDEIQEPKPVDRSGPQDNHLQVIFNNCYFKFCEHCGMKVPAVKILLEKHCIAWH